MSADWINISCAALTVILFGLLFFKLRILEKTRQITASALDALTIISDVSLPDEKKEKLIQSAVLGMLRQLFVLIICCVTSLGSPALIIFLLEQTGWVSLNQVIGITLSWFFLSATTVLAILAWVVIRRRNPQHENKEGSGFEVRYSFIEKLLHQLAFATRDLQILLSYLEDRLFIKSDCSEQDRAVFITALPRAGTTLLMELCVNTGLFVTHTYRDMPFVLTPALWRKISRPFQTRGAERERAHGDGMMVSVDSPEAFEEMLWMPFWKEQYKADQILPWPQNSKAKFDSFFTRHRYKLRLTSPDVHSPHYLSKNNLNISRLELLLKSVSGGRFLIPFRHPESHCQSLLRQHLNFLSVHQQDKFSKAYMAGVGHFDFGENLKPINFDNWLESSPYKDAKQLSFWYAYWVASYQHLLTIESDRILFIDFDALCTTPDTELKRISDFLSLKNPEPLYEQSKRLRIPKVQHLELSGIDTELKAQVIETYEMLQAKGC